MDLFLLNFSLTFFELGFSMPRATFELKRTWVFIGLHWFNGKVLPWIGEWHASSPLGDVSDTLPEVKRQVDFT